MLIRAVILEVEARKLALCARIHETVRHRDRGLVEWKMWEDACHEWHGYRHPIDTLWSDEFREALKAGDREAIEDAILFLEVDPWYFRSGYLKERLLRILRQAPLEAIDQKRLRDLILRVASGVNRREFRYFCQLATILADSDFRILLANVSADQDLLAKGKFGYLRGFVEKAKQEREPR